MNEIKTMEMDVIQIVSDFIDLLACIDQDWKTIYDEIGKADEETP